MDEAWKAQMAPEGPDLVLPAQLSLDSNLNFILLNCVCCYVCMQALARMGVCGG